ncbi:unnamed protein product [Nesidiocoris tenuis]|uniref:Uncharacterized protein n=1 Tax=Nesidiocoris tenuis TaxID=355587 RepID=A0A6H5H3Q4_9HEMI|nr:unnamed protein product [Nesidiocoris tenuis]
MNFICISANLLHLVEFDRAQSRGPQLFEPDQKPVRCVYAAVRQKIVYGKASNNSPSITASKNSYWSLRRKSSSSDVTTPSPSTSLGSADSQVRLTCRYGRKGRYTNSTGYPTLSRRPAICDSRYMARASKSNSVGRCTGCNEVSKAMSSSPFRRGHARNKQNSVNGRS